MPADMPPPSAAQICRYFLPYLRPYRGKLALAGVFLLLSVLMHLARPWPLKFIFDRVLLGAPGSDRTKTLLLACAGFLLVAVLYGVAEYFHTILAAGAGQSAVYRLRNQLYAHIQRLSLSFHSRTKSGDLLSRLTNEVNQLRDFLSDSLLQLVSESLFVAGMITVMFLMDWRLTLAGLLLFPLLAVSIRHFSGRIRRLTRKRLQREGQVASLFNETLAAIEAVHLFSGEAQEARRFEEENRRSFKADLKALRSQSKLLRVVEVVTAIGTCCVLWWGARRVLAGALTPGDLLVFIAYLKNLHKPVRRIAQLAVQSSKALASAERVAQILRTEPEIRDAPDAIAAPPLRGAVEFRNVTFAYQPPRLALDGIYFRVEPGQTVAITGPSGAGKSTLASLLPRLYDPLHGAVLIDGVDIRRYTLASLRDQISVVPQNPILFGSTIRENIAYGDPDADDKAIHLAARLARADEFIEQLPHGYDTVLGERGATLSGGQRQRIAIARALLRDAPIVLLDEPMTGLDLPSERLILEALRNLLQNKTAFLIAHRLTTILESDLVVVLDAGRVVEIGLPHQLYQANGYFRKLAELQFGVQPQGPLQ